PTARERSRGRQATTDAQRGRAAPASREPATVDVELDSSPPGADVVLDGALLGTTPFRGTITRRDRAVRLGVHLAGYADRTVVARASQSIAERVTLVRKPGSASKPRSDGDRSVNPF